MKRAFGLLIVGSHFIYEGERWTKVQPCLAKGPSGSKFPFPATMLVLLD